MIIFTNKDETKFKKVTVDTSTCDRNDAYEDLRKKGFAFYPTQDASDDNSDLTSLIEAINSLSIEHQIQIANKVYQLEKHDNHIKLYDLADLPKDKQKFYDAKNGSGTEQDFATEFITGKDGILKPLNRLYYDNYTDSIYPGDFSPKLGILEIEAIIYNLNKYLPKTKWYSWRIRNCNEIIYAWIYNEKQLPIDPEARLVDDGKTTYLGNDWLQYLYVLVKYLPLYEIIDCDQTGQALNDHYRNVVKTDFAHDKDKEDVRNPEVDKYMRKMYQMTPIRI